MSNCLVLLIGTNPLPNYVVAKHLLSKNGVIDTIWLVYSADREGIQSGTKDFADNLKAVISKEHSQINFEECSLSDVGNAQTIRNEIKDKLLNHLKNGSNIHLNYTGGTKVMSVHVYNSLQEAEGLGNKIFSYLDARNFNLRYDSGEISDDLREEVSVSLDKLIELHGYQKKTQTESYAWKDSLQKLSEFINNNNLKDFLAWKNGVIRKLYYDENGKFIESVQQARENLSKYTDLFNNHPFKEKALSLLKTFRNDFSILDRSEQSLWVPDNSVTARQYKSRVEPSVRNFLDGKWLENHVHRVLKEKINKEFKDKVIPIENNWVLIRKGDNNKDFEIDVIIINGYQVCGISCTTDEREPLCKGKGFEVVHRVNQIGGEEAKAVLVTCLTKKYKEKVRGEEITIDQVKRVQDDLRYETGGGEKLIVLGIEDLKEGDLWKNIKTHLWG